MVSFAEGYHRAIHGDCPPLSEDEHNSTVGLTRGAVSADLWTVYRAPLEYANSRSQRKRLGDLIDRAFEVVPDWQLGPKLFRDEVIDTRNWLIHWGEKGRNTVEGPVARALLVHRLVVVMYANLTLDLGFDAHAVAQVIAKGWRELP